MAPASSPSVAEWPLPSSATLGSSVRAKGIERELRRGLPWAMRKHLAVEAGRVILSLPDATDFQALANRIGEAIEGLGELPLLPSEVEDVLTISARERHKWLEDGRLQSAGTRTVKLRARAVTFHVFDPRRIETILNGDLPAIWRQEDAKRGAEKRRRAAAKAALVRTRKVEPQPEGTGNGVREEVAPHLAGWDEFDADGLLR